MHTSSGIYESPLLLFVYGNIYLTCSICFWFKVLGNVTLNNTNRFPNLYGFLWNGRPFSSTVIKLSGLITWPGVLLILKEDPSKYSTMKSQPVRDSNNDISFSINKSAPFLLNTLWGCSSTTIITSPGSQSGYSSDSPWNKYFSPWGAPLSTSTSNTFFSLTTFLPLHTLHLRASSIYSPVPLQSVQGPVD